MAAVLDGVGLILHAGDVCLVETLQELEQFAPVWAVLGNNDGDDVKDWGAPEIMEADLGGLSLAMLHDSGPASGRGRRLRSRFPSASLVVFGHSHIPWDVKHAGQRAFNPGSPTDRRRQAHGTMGELVVEDGTLVSARVLEVT